MRFIRFLLASITLAASPSAEAAPVLSHGKGHFQFSKWAGPAIRVFYYRPPSAARGAPILIVMHGTQRDARRYRDEWAPLARKQGFVVVAPEFSRKKFPGVASYNLGGVRDREGRALARRKWTFAAIEPLFDEVRARTGSTRTTYYLYGHSAGGQFVHRFVMHMGPSRVQRAFAANSGWYLMPSARIKYPYGIAGSGVSTARLKSALSKRLTILVGEHDIELDENVRRTQLANDQGENRRVRGIKFIRNAKRRAAALGIACRWELTTVPDAAHDNAAIAKAVALSIGKSVAG